MRLLIVGTLDGQLGAASQIAMERGAQVTHAPDFDAAMQILRSRGADPHCPGPHFLGAGCEVGMQVQ